MQIAAWLQDIECVRHKSHCIADVMRCYKWSADSSEALISALLRLPAPVQRTTFHQAYLSTSLRDILIKVPFVLMHAWARDFLAHSSHVEPSSLCAYSASKCAPQSCELVLVPRWRTQQPRLAALRGGMSQRLDVDACAALCLHLPHLQQLRHVAICEHHVGDNELSLLVLALAALGALTHLDLSSNAGGELAARMLGDKLPHSWPQLQALDYNHNGADDAAALSVLACGLQGAMALTELQLADTGSWDGNSVLDAALQQLPALKCAACSYEKLLQFGRRVEALTVLTEDTDNMPALHGRYTDELRLHCGLTRLELQQCSGAVDISELSFASLPELRHLVRITCHCHAACACVVHRHK